MNVRRDSKVDTAVGIVAEYNPFHNGHQYLAAQARKMAHADTVIAIMSGNWVQRGEPAMFDKWHRAEAAIAAGVDLVVELPFFGAVQPSHIFSKSAVKIAQAVGCDALSFGAEHPDMDYDVLIANQPVRADAFKRFDRPYATIFQEYLRKKTGIVLKEPNDILGFGYANANHELGNPLKLYPVNRKGANHNDKCLEGSLNIGSASAIRNEIQRNNLAAIKDFVPKTTLEMVGKSFQYDWNQFWPFLRYELIESSIDRLHEIYQMTEGIEYRLKDSAKKAQSFSEFLNLVKTKRYTYARIQRLCVYVLVQCFEDDMLAEPSYIRPLAFNQQGRKHLNQIKHDVDWPIITKVTDEQIKNQLLLDYQSSMLLQTISNENQDIYRYPIIKN